MFLLLLLWSDCITYLVIKIKLFKLYFLKPYETYMNTKSTFVETLGMYFKKN